MKLVMSALAFIALSSTAMAFDFNAFPGQYQLMKDGALQGNCPSAISILQNAAGARSFHVYNLDLTADEARVSASIFLDEVGKGWTTHNSAGEKSQTRTVINEADPTELVWTVKGRHYIDEGNRIPAPSRAYSYYVVIAQGDNLDVMALSQHKISGKRVADELECLYERMK